MEVLTPETALALVVLALGCVSCAYALAYVAKHTSGKPYVEDAMYQAHDGAYYFLLSSNVTNPSGYDKRPYCVYCKLGDRGNPDEWLMVPASEFGGSIMVTNDVARFTRVE